MATNRFSKADVLYRSMVRNTFFSQGWGTLNVFRNLQRLKADLFDTEKFKQMVSAGVSSVEIDKVYEVKSKHDSHSVVDGHFVSPLVNDYPGLLPKESEVARFQAIVPTNHTAGKKSPMCVQLAGTGDHHFWRRRNLVAKPLLRENSIGSVLLVNPYYGCRKPKTQTRSSLNCVVDLFVMGCALIVEASVLLNWCEGQGYGPLALTGVSMGGHMASLAATFVQKPLAIIPCLSWSTAAPVFTEGVLSKAVAWSVLENQLKDSDFFNELLHICQQAEVDGVNARNSSMTNTEIDNFSSFQHVSSHVSNNAGNTTFTHESLQDFSSKSYMSENSSKSIKDHLDNDIKQHKPRKYQRARKFMKYILDTMTHLAYYRKPVDPDLAVFIAARYDGYVPRNDCHSPLELWPGCQVKYTEFGHIVAALYKRDVFRKTIAETLNKIA